MWRPLAILRRRSAGFGERSTVQDARRAEFESLLEEHGPALYGAALRMTSNPQDGQDLFQETMARAFQSFSSFQPGTNFRAWTLRILTWLHILAYRRHNQVQFQPLDEVPAEDHRPRETGTALPTRTSCARLLASCLDKDVATALGALPHDVKLAVQLVDMEELSFEEAAEAMDVPVGTLRSRLYRGRDQLRRSLLRTRQAQEPAAK